ncbi:hypothetical protein Tcan_01370, partial [Toxocara canis]
PQYSSLKNHISSSCWSAIRCLHVRKFKARFGQPGTVPTRRSTSKLVCDTSSNPARFATTYTSTVKSYLEYCSRLDSAWRLPDKSPITATQTQRILGCLLTSAGKHEWNRREYTSQNTTNHCVRTLCTGVLQLYCSHLCKMCKISYRPPPLP